MDKEVKNFLKSINYEITDDTFSASHISKVILNKEERKFYVYLNNEYPFNLEEIEKLLSCSHNGIKEPNDVKINFVYDNIKDDDVLNAITYILEKEKDTHPSLVTITKENIKVSDKMITISIASKTEEDILNELKEEFITTLNNYGYLDYEININLDNEMTDSVIKEIEEEKNRPVDIVIPPETPSSNTSYYKKKIMFI